MGSQPVDGEAGAHDGGPASRNHARPRSQDSTARAHSARSRDSRAPAGDAHGEPGRNGERQTSSGRDLSPAHAAQQAKTGSSDVDAAGSRGADEKGGSADRHGDDDAGADGGAGRRAARGPRRDHKHRAKFISELIPDELKHAHAVAKYCPLIAAIAAPLSTLMDIPALSQHWYTLNGVVQHDPKACIILSAIGLALNIMANALLVVRFSSKTPFWWQTGTKLSLVFWVGKTVVAGVNLIVFGILTRNGAGYAYSEGFWCAVVSICDAGVISLALVFHYFFAFGNPRFDKQDIRHEGRKFMLSVTAFISILALQALVYCKVEQWAYADSIYFSVQTALTIGYGDFAPVTTAGKVLVFPFSVLTISQLGNEVAMIVSFIGARADERRDKWRKRYEGAMHREANKLRPHASLVEEMALISQINKREEGMSQLYDLLWSAFSLVVFWVIGALIFNKIEGWTYGNAVYAVMILSLTIGFGDFTPVTEAGKVVWIVYALMAVPIVTSFAVQTITGIVSALNHSIIRDLTLQLGTWQQNRFERDAFSRERARDPEAFAPHAHFVERYHDLYRHIHDRLVGHASTDDGTADGAERGKQGVDADIDNEAHANEQVDSAGKTMAGADEPGDAATQPGAGADGAGDEELRRERSEARHAQAKAHAKQALQEEDEHEKEAAHDDDEVAGSGADDYRDSGRDSSEATRVDSDSGGRLGRVRSASASPARAGLPDGQDAQWDDPASERDRGAQGHMERKLGEGTARIKRDADRIGDERDRVSAAGDGDGDDGGDGHAPGQTGQTASERDLERDLLRQLVNRTVQLEAEARQMLLDSMNKGIARTLLLADRNVQIRDVRALRGDDANLAAIWRGEEDRRAHDAQERDKENREHDEGAEDMLARVRHYRNTFAEILVLASILQKLDGEDQNRFERWRSAAEAASMASGGGVDEDGPACHHPHRPHLHEAERREERKVAAKPRAQSLMMRLTRTADGAGRATGDDDADTDGRAADPLARAEGGAGQGAGERAAHADAEAEQDETLDELADARYSGITGRLFKRHTRKLREKPFKTI